MPNPPFLDHSVCGLMSEKGETNDPTPSLFL